jgi:NAD(P)-dependent dehydrogenase (short-subunit alcohol dehydrogenase family)
VAIFDRNQKALDAVAKPLASFGVEAHRVDIVDEPAVAAALDALVGRRGRLDVVVNCAAIVGPTATPITEVGLDDFAQVLEVNLLGSFVVAKQALVQMRKTNQGRILLFASIAGEEATPGCAPTPRPRPG